MFILNANKEIIEVRRPAFNAPKSSPISENCSRCGELVIKHTTKATIKHEGTKEKRKMGGNKRPLRSLRSNNSGVLYVYLVIIIALFAGGFFAFIMATGIGQIQESINPHLGQDRWSTEQHYTAFSLAATFVTNLWVLFPAVIIFGLAYWGYVEAQRRTD